MLNVGGPRSSKRTPSESKQNLKSVFRKLAIRVCQADCTVLPDAVMDGQENKLQWRNENYLHHNKTATATLCQKILADDIGVVPIQEPWTVKGKVMGMSSVKSKQIYDTTCDMPEACIFVKDKALKMTDLCSREAAVYPCRQVRESSES
nr:unnamed protein product [Callosobruchus analis]